MCGASNRDIFNVLFGGMNNAPAVKGQGTGPKEHTETTIPAVAEMLCNAKEVGEMRTLTTLVSTRKIPRCSWEMQRRLQMRWQRKF